MKKISVMALVMALLVTMVVSSVSAAEMPTPYPLGETPMEFNSSNAADLGTTTSSTAVNKAVKKLTNIADYWGWSSKIGKTVIMPNKVLVAKVTLTNSKYEYSNIEVRVTPKRVRYRYGGYNYPLKSWKVMLKQYSVKADLKKLVVEKAKAAAKDLQKYGKSNKWTCNRSNTYKSNKAYENLDFSNARYLFKVRVVAVRKSGKLSVIYKVGGVKTTKSWIKNCLRQYAVSTSKGAADCFGSAGLIELVPGADGSVVESAPEASLEEASFSGELLNSASEASTTDSVEESTTIELEGLDTDIGGGELIELELAE